MKRGRPTKRYKVQTKIIECLEEFNTPASVNAITRFVREKLRENISWNTVKKYLEELVEMGKVEALSTPHSKKEGEEGLTIYALKK
ncbi:MAG: hypothetical protein DRP00_03590 [Candidatus Aenigmatarchaeota archaeon]|nr:MAG: hypothetical protein DRP00_03590 [Candidatus Aenigmarchaeota archaeon]